MNFDLTTIITSFVSGVISASAVAGWLAKYISDRSLAKHKGELDKEVERLKATLQLTAIEHQIRFMKLHEKRAEVIAELYGQVFDVQMEAQKFVLNESMQKENEGEFNAISKKMFEFYRFIEMRRIYLPEDICKLLDTILETLRTHVVKTGVYGPIQPRNEITQKQSHEAFTAAYEAFEKEIPKLRVALEKEFRDLLCGITTMK